MVNNMFGSHSRRVLFSFCACVTSQKAAGQGGGGQHGLFEKYTYGVCIDLVVPAAVISRPQSLFGVAVASRLVKAIKAGWRRYIL